MSYSTDPSNVPLELFVGGYTTQTDNIETVLFDSNGPGLQGIVLLTPADGAINVSVTPSFTWDSETDYDGYKVLIADNAEYTNAREAYVTAKNYNEVTALLNNTNYFWKVKGGDITDRPAIVVQGGSDNSRAGDEESLRLHAVALESDNWYNNTGWDKTSMSLDDEIYGVTIETIRGEKRVTEIDLMANNLVGQLPEFPGLQECRRARFKQIEANKDFRTMTERISGPIPDSWGINTKCTELSFAGRRDFTGQPADYLSLADDDPGGYNMKFGIAANQYTNGIPDSLYNLKLKKLEIDGQYSTFNGQLKDGCGNWEITHIYLSGNDFYDSGESAIFGELPSETKNWVNCVRYNFQENPGITYIPVDCFEGWNNIVRVIQIDGNHTQPIPDLTGLTKVLEFFTGNLTFSGPYPKFFHDFENIRTLTFTRHAFNDSSDLDFQDSNIDQTYNIQLSSLDPANLTGNFFTGSVGYKGIILFNLSHNSRLQSIITDGVNNWWKTRYYNAKECGGGVLPSQPPAMYGCSLRGIDLNTSAITGNLESDWKYAGALEDRGGIVTSFNITGFGTDGTNQHWVEDENANFPDLSGKLLNNINSTSGTKRRSIISNTSTRIYYDWWMDDEERDFDLLEIGNPFEVTHNPNTDNRALNENIDLSSNFIKDAVPVDVAPLYMVDGNFNLRLNLFRMKDIAPAVANIEKRSRMNWLIRDPRSGSISGANSSGTVSFSFNGNTVSIQIDASQTGEQQAQQIADEITNNSGIQLTCEFVATGQTLVFDTSLTGINNALKNITFTDDDDTGFTFESQGYDFIYAPQGRLSERENYKNRNYKPEIPNGYEVPDFFQDKSIQVTAGNNHTIDFSDEEYSGNEYYWYRRLNSQSSFSLMSGENGSSLTITDFQSTDEGEYYCEIENADAPDFQSENAMRSGTITLSI